MKNKHLPYIHFYPGDWRKDPGIQALDYESRGVWFELLLLMYESKPRGKMTLDRKKKPNLSLARMLGLSHEKTMKIIGKIMSHGVASVDETGALCCRRMLRDEEIRQKRAISGAIGGKAKALAKSEIC